MTHTATSDNSHKGDNRLLYHLVAFAVVAVWGSTFVFTKLLLLGGLSAAQIFTLRFIIAYVLLTAFSLLKGIRWVADSWRKAVTRVSLARLSSSGLVCRLRSIDKPISNYFFYGVLLPLCHQCYSNHCILGI